MRGHDELGRLSKTFDAMATAVASSQDRLTADIAQRARVQQALANSKEQYRSMFNASIDGLVSWNEDARVVDVNPAMWQIFGYTQEELMAFTPRRLMGPASPADFLRTVTAGKPQNTEVTASRKDVSTVFREVHAIPMRYQGKPHVLPIARDITERKLAAESLARQQASLYQREKLASLGTLLAGVAHELNNPLSVVVARSVLLEEQSDPTTRNSALKIRIAAERCARIVRTFLAMARQHEPERGPVAINNVVTAALDITAYAVRTSSINMELDLGMNIPLFFADADQLHQVLLNLIINAQQALQDHSLPRQIRLSTYFDPVADTIRITVADNGLGIPVALQARVFEPYFTTKGSGMGVGLAVSRGIVEAHAGSLSIDCPPGRGTHFHIVLPVVPVESGLEVNRLADEHSTGHLFGTCR